MTLLHTDQLVNDLQAVVAAITPSQMEILTSIQEVVQERIKELEDEVSTKACAEAAEQEV